MLDSEIQRSEYYSTIVPIEEITKGLVKVEDLRPDLKWYVIRQSKGVNP